jgi:hypothetical protein
VREELRIEFKKYKEELRRKKSTNLSLLLTKIQLKFLQNKNQKLNGTSKPVPVTDRLTKDASDRLNNISQKQASYLTSQSLQYPFQPSIVSSSHLPPKPFHERQEEFLKKKLEKYENYRQEEGKEFSFKPTINSTSGIIIESDPQRAGETTEERYLRLYHKDARKQEEKKSAIEEELYGKYTYHPQINQLSRLMAADRNQTDVFEKSTVKSIFNKNVLQETEEKFKQECTFKPKINKNFNDVQSAYVNKEEMKTKLAEKTRERFMKQEKERMDKEYDELKDCTFRPTINQGIPEAHREVVVVRGLARHMELQELKQKKTRDQLEREAKVFGLGHKFAPNLDLTSVSFIPDPPEYEFEE